MAYSALETESIITNFAALVDAGITQVGVYMRGDRAPFQMTQGLLSAGIKLWSVYEKGEPNHDGYFTADQAAADAENALAWAKMTGQPGGTIIFVAVDYDATIAAVEAYLIAFHAAIKAAGYLMGVYGGWPVISWAVESGYSHATWLSGSTGWSGYGEGEARCDILQINAPDGVLGLSGDWNIVRNPAVLWG